MSGILTHTPMMMSFITAVWLGVLTSISPCPLSTNIAAVSFISKRGSSRHSTLFSGLIYALGRSAAYIIIGFLISAGLFSSSYISVFFQTYMQELLGPMLIILGLILLGWISSSASVSFSGSGEGLKKRLEKGGLFWAFPLGFVFALTFCPVSAGLFFGALLPLAVAEKSSFFIPLLFSLGTALPVIIFSLILSYASEYTGRAYNALGILEKYMRNLFGAGLIIYGLYSCITVNFILL